MLPGDSIGAAVEQWIASHLVEAITAVFLIAQMWTGFRQLKERLDKLNDKVSRHDREIAEIHGHIGVERNSR